MAAVAGLGFRKTAAMSVIELQDAALRNGARRDVRAIIGEWFLVHGTLTGVADEIGVDLSTLSVWVRDHLCGEIEGPSSPNACLRFADWPEAYDLRAARRAA